MTNTHRIERFASESYVVHVTPHTFVIRDDMRLDVQIVMLYDYEISDDIIDAIVADLRMLRVARGINEEVL